MLEGKLGKIGARAGLTPDGQVREDFLEEASAQLSPQNCLTFTLVKCYKDIPDRVEHMSTGPE